MVSDLGTEVQCSDCGHLFVVKRPASASSPASKSPSPDAPDEGDWVVETSAGSSLRLDDLTTLHKWIIEHRVGREDRFSRDGKSWQRLGDLADLTPFFDIVASAERARTADASVPAPLPAPLAPPVLMPPTALSGGPSPEHGSREVHRLASRVIGLGAKAKNEVGAYVGASSYGADPDRTVLVPLEPPKSRGLLKLLLTMLVATVVAYTGILLQHHRERSTVISSSGTAETPTLPKTPSVVVPAPPARAPMKTAEATQEESPESSDTSARGPVVQPIDDEKPREAVPLLGETPRRAAPATSHATRRTKAQPTARSHGREARTSTAKPHTPQAEAAQGYVALNHRQYARAVVLFKRALAKSPSNGTALFGLAEAYRNGGEIGPALQTYRRYVEILPSGPEATTARYHIRILESKRH